MQPIDACSAIRPCEKASQVVFAGIWWFECSLFARQDCTAFEIETDISEYGNWSPICRPLFSSDIITVTVA
jgi:hypothetical protein